MMNIGTSSRAGPRNVFSISGAIHPSRSYAVRVKGSNTSEGGGPMAQTEAGYRRKWKKWLAIYLAVAVIAYLIVFLVFFRHGGGGGSGIGY
jgi:hypothetical protein